MNPHPQKENFYFFIANVDNDASDSINLNYESDRGTWMDVDEIQKMMDEDPSQFRDAFRIAFRTIDWHSIADRAQQPLILQNNKIDNLLSA